MIHTHYELWKHSLTKTWNILTGSGPEAAFPFKGFSFGSDLASISKSKLDRSGALINENLKNLDRKWTGSSLSADLLVQGRSGASFLAVTWQVPVLVKKWAGPEFGLDFWNISKSSYNVEDSSPELGPKSRANDFLNSLQNHLNREQSFISYNNICRLKLLKALTKTQFGISSFKELFRK